MERFNPKDTKYKKVEDLPDKEQDKFTDVDNGGFVRKSAMGLLERYGTGSREKKYALSEIRQDAELFNNYFTNKDVLINKLPDLLNQSPLDLKVLAMIAKDLGMNDFPEKIEKLSRSINIPTEDVPLYAIEDICKDVLTIINKFDKDAVPLLEALTNSFTKLESTNYKMWSHAVCHLIESYESKSKESLLNSPESRDVLTKLVDESVRRQIHDSPKDIGSSPRIVGPILNFNLDNVDLSNLDQRFEYKPDSLSDQEYIKIMKAGLAEHEWKITAFLESNSPLEYYRYIIENGKELPGTPEEEIQILQSLEKITPADVINKYVSETYKPNGKDITYEDMVANYKESKESKEVVNGVYVDVEGTLIRRFELNKDLVGKLERYANEGREIVIFTGGDVTSIEGQLKQLGFPEKFLPVRSKSDYRGKVLETLIDDTPPEYQGFRAIRLERP